MADLNDVLELVRAGWTKEEINNIINTAVQQGEDGAGSGEVGNSPEEQTGSGKAEPPAYLQQITELNKSIKNLGDLLVASNINKSNQPEAESTMDILGRIIDPPIYRQKERDK